MKRVQLDIRDMGGRCLYYTCDVSSRKDIYKAAELMTKDVGDPDICICNAGIGSEKGAVCASSDDLIDKVVNCNFTSNWWMVKRFLPSMQARGYGHFVLVSSIAGLRGFSIYGATKVGCSASPTRTQQTRRRVLLSHLLHES